MYTANPMPPRSQSHARHHRIGSWFMPHATAPPLAHIPHRGGLRTTSHAHSAQQPPRGRRTTSSHHIARHAHRAPTHGLSTPTTRRGPARAAHCEPRARSKRTSKRRCSFARYCWFVRAGLARWRRPCCRERGECSGPAARSPHCPASGCADWRRSSPAHPWSLSPPCPPHPCRCRHRSSAS